MDFLKTMPARRSSPLISRLAILGFGASAFFVGRMSVRSTMISGSVTAAKSEEKKLSIAGLASRESESAATTRTVALDWEARWKEYSAQPSTRTRDEQLIASLEE